MLNQPVFALSLEMFFGALLEEALIELIGVLPAIAIATETCYPELTVSPADGRVSKKRQQGWLSSMILISCGQDGSMSWSHEGGNGLNGFAGIVRVGVE
jgi:hypothetical protein